MNTGTNESAFSQTTVSSGCNTNTGLGGNISLASTGSYQDFAVCIHVVYHTSSVCDLHSCY